MKSFLSLILASTITIHAQPSLSETWATACITAGNQPKIMVLYQLIKRIQTSDELRQHYHIDLTDEQKAFIAQSIGIFGPCKREYAKKYSALRHLQSKYRTEKRAYKKARLIQKLIEDDSTSELALITT